MQKKFFWCLLIIICSILCLFFLTENTQNTLPISNSNRFSPNSQKKATTAKNFEPTRSVDHLPAQKKQTVEKLLADNHFSGTCLLVTQGKIKFLRAYGWQNWQKKQRNQVATAYPVNSLQKSLTAYLMMKLVLNHQLTFDQKIGKFYPKVLGAQQITLREVLNMASSYQLKSPPTQAKTDQQVIKNDLTHLKYAPQRIGHYNYQDVNYTLLAGIAEKITGKSYQALADKYVIKQLHLLNSGFILNSSKKLPTGYMLQNNHWQKQQIKPTAVISELGASNMYMSAWDVYRFEAALRNGKLLPEKDDLYLYLQTPKDPYTAGIYPTPEYERLHGIGFGFESSAAISSNGKTAVILLSNHWNPQKMLQNTLLPQLYRLITVKWVYTF